MDAVTVKPSVQRKQRFLELDLARAVLILMLPFVHCYEEFANGGYLSAGAVDVGSILLYLCALGPAGFMIYLGMNVVFSSHSTPGELCRRGLKTIGYFCLLNVCRAVLPSFVAWLNGFDYAFEEGLTWALSSDILFFAGCAFLFFALMLKLRARPLHMLIVSLLLLTLNTLIPPIDLESTYLTAFLGNFFYINETSYFPLLSWLIFPSIGYCAGQTIKTLDTTQKKNRFYLGLALFSAALLIALYVCMAYYGLDPILIAASPANEYRTDLFNVLLDTCLVGVWTGVVYYACSLMRSKRVLSAAHKVSDAILVFYCVQWALVGWLEYMLLIAGLGGQVVLTDASFVLISVAVFAVSLAVSLAVKRWSRTRKAKGRETYARA